jgi:PleD family two-component response regulator
VAAFPQHGADPGTLLHQADEALYRAKNEGRDRVNTATA